MLNIECSEVIGFPGQEHIILINNNQRFLIMKVTIKRVYEKPGKEDGYRILADRLWPRGLTKEKAAVDLWLKEIAPSTELRKWFNHDPEKWKDFQKKYTAELKKNIEPVTILKEKIKKGPVTIVYGARDQEHNEAQVILDYISGK